jgi:hypothetical protein
MILSNPIFHPTSQKVMPGITGCHNLIDSILMNMVSILVPKGILSAF